MTLDRCHDDLKLVLSAVEIHSPTQYSIRGELRDFSNIPLPTPGESLTSGVTPDKTTPAHEPDSDAPVFQTFLEGELYSRLYTRPAAALPASDPLAQRDHVSALSTANNGLGTWEPGWKIGSIDDDGRVVVTRDQVTFWVSPTGLRTSTGKIRPGGFCRVWVGKEFRQLVPGFYFAMGNGNQRDSHDAAYPLVRLYWNLKVETAVPYMALITERLNREGIPFRTKVLSDPASYIRADAGVLYIERRYFRSIRGIVRDIHQTIRSGLRPETPMFTKPLAEGLGVAEDPNNGQSFGQSRCRIVAQALWSSFLQGVTDPDLRLAALAGAFREAGLNPEFPFLERGAGDIYNLAADFSTTPSSSLLTIEELPHRSRKHRREKVSL